MTNLTELAHDPRYDATREVRAPRGARKACRSWLTEAVYRMIQNNLDPEVAENPKHLVVYGGIGRAARDWSAFDRILAVLKELDDDESLLIQSGKPVGVFKTHPDAPRVLIANSNLVPRWATWDHFNELDRKGLGGVSTQELDAHAVGAAAGALRPDHASLDLVLRARRGQLEAQLEYGADRRG